jgi:hypothetical protein
MELRKQFEVDLAMAVVEHKGQSSVQGRNSWNAIKTLSFRRNLSHEKTEGLPKYLGKSFDAKYEGI